MAELKDLHLERKVDTWAKAQKDHTLKVILKKEGNQWKSYENFTGEKPFLLSY